MIIYKYFVLLINVLIFFNDIKYELTAVGKNNFPSNYITCNTGKNI